MKWQALIFTLSTNTEKQSFKLMKTKTKVLWKEKTSQKASSMAGTSVRWLLCWNFGDVEPCPSWIYYQTFCPPKLNLGTGFFWIYLPSWIYLKMSCEFTSQVEFTFRCLVNLPPKLNSVTRFFLNLPTKLNLPQVFLWIYLLESIYLKTFCEFTPKSNLATGFFLNLPTKLNLPQNFL